ncbi:MAG: hypothetical protein COS85_17315 [Armatimonadetes bacterium CG07_land_8_20_14_0_80_59_28]|nr:MAG: hypothetical protein COS85_17315 [Armatimonadetes bacterium CG07_land_8_20_14_0_80_59_28]
MCRSIGDKVYAVADGKVVNEQHGGNVTESQLIWIEHCVDGGKFYAIYAHVNHSKRVDDEVNAGDEIATVADYLGSCDHLHFGINPNGIVTTKVNGIGWGAGPLPADWDCNNQDKSKLETRGFVAPYDYLNSHTPCGGGGGTTYTVTVRTKVDGGSYNAAAKLSKWVNDHWETVPDCDWATTPYSKGGLPAARYRCEYGTTVPGGNVPAWYNVPAAEEHGSPITGDFTFEQEYQRKDWYARYMGQSIDMSPMVPGETRVFRYTFRNEGKNAWDQNVRLGTVNPQNRDSAFCTSGDWISCGRPTAANENPVNGGGADGNLDFVVTAPCTPGHYEEHFNILYENHFWFGGDSGGQDVSFAVDVAAPSAPSAPTLASPQPGSCGASPTLTWNAVSGGPCGGTVSYFAEIKGANPPNNSRDWITGRSWTPTGLAPGANCTWRVKAKSNVGESAWSGEWTFHVNQAPNKPTLSSPANNACVGSRAVQLCWNDAGDPDNCPSARTYRVVVPGAFDQSGIASTCQTVTVNADGAFSWYVLAYDGQAWSAASDTRSFTVDATPPNAPTGLTVAPDHFTATLAWTAPVETGCSGVAGYNVYRRRNGSSGYVKVNTTPVTGVTHTDTLANGVAYDYAVAAVDTFGREGAKVEATNKVIGKPGDMNGDGEIDIADVIKCINVINDPNASAVDKALADYNRDNKADAADVEAMKKAILGK